MVPSLILQIREQTMIRTALLATTALMLVTTARAATLQTSLATFQTTVGASAINTTSVLGNNFDPISAVRLVNGTTIALSGALDVVDQPGFGDLPFANGYTGQVVDSTNNTETLTFSTPRTRFGFTVSPDVSFIGPASTSVTFTVTLGDGTTTTLTNSFVGGGTQFFGFTGSPETSLTITSSSPNFAFGQFLTVPEPASVLLLGTALIPLLRRRRTARLARPRPSAA